MFTFACFGGLASNYKLACQMPKKDSRAGASIMKNREPNPKRLQLMALSRTMKAMMDVGEIEAATINEALIEHYSKGEDLEFKTFHQWKKDGKRVNKGSSAYVVWGKPRQISKPSDKPAKEESDEDKMKYWPMAYLFSENQVTDQEKGS